MASLHYFIRKFTRRQCHKKQGTSRNTLRVPNTFAGRLVVILLIAFSIWGMAGAEPMLTAATNDPYCWAKVKMRSKTWKLVRNTRGFIDAAFNAKNCANALGIKKGQTSMDMKAVRDSGRDMARLFKYFGLPPYIMENPWWTEEDTANTELPIAGGMLDKHRAGRSKRQLHEDNLTAHAAAEQWYVEYQQQVERHKRQANHYMKMKAALMELATVDPNEIIGKAAHNRPRCFIWWIIAMLVVVVIVLVANQVWQIKCSRDLETCADQAEESADHFECKLNKSDKAWRENKGNLQAATSSIRNLNIKAFRYKFAKDIKNNLDVTTGVINNSLPGTTMSLTSWRASNPLGRQTHDSPRNISGGSLSSLPRRTRTDFPGEMVPTPHGQTTTRTSTKFPATAPRSGRRRPTTRRSPLPLRRTSTGRSWTWAMTRSTSRRATARSSTSHTQTRCWTPTRLRPAPAEPFTTL
jgi:hypothetical protein